MGNWKKYSVVGLVLIAVWGAAMSVSKAVGCDLCVEILSPFEQNLTKVEQVTESPSGVTVSTTTVVE